MLGGTSACQHAERLIFAFVQAGVPFDGVLGFSNGAAAAAMLLASPMPAEEVVPALRFALFAGGYCPNALHDMPPLALPSLHMVGTGDDLVTPEDSAKLAALFERPRHLVHEQGHIVPQRSSDSAIIVGFLRDQIESSLEARKARE